MSNLQNDINIQQSAEATRQLIFSVAEALVDNKEAVAVQVQQGDDCTTLVLLVAPDDLGKLIGRDGRMARSIRTILSAAGMKQQRRYSLDIRAN